MKKKIISLLLVLSAFLITSGVSAKEMSKDDIKPGTYMIGTHLFTRETVGDYNGTLTVRYIMLAARTINSTNINDMIIYLKNSRGKWVNAVTNEEVTVPDKVDIYYENSVEEFLPEIKLESLLSIESGQWNFAPSFDMETSMSEKEYEFELYEKTNSGYNFVAVSPKRPTQWLLSVDATNEIKTYVGRLAITNSKGEKIYSDYSDEVIINAKDILGKPDLKYGCTGAACSIWINYNTELANEVNYVVYEKTNESYTEVGTAVSNGGENGTAVSITLTNEPKTYVTRFYITNSAGEKLYSDYSDEVIINAKDILGKPVLEYSYEASEGKLNFNLKSDSKYLTSPENAFDYSVELYEENGESFDLIKTEKYNTSTGGSIMSITVPSDVKTYKARLYIKNSNSEKIYSDYSNLIFIDPNGIIQLEEVAVVGYEEENKQKVTYKFKDDIYTKYTNIEVLYMYEGKTDWELYSDTITASEEFEIEQTFGQIPERISVRLYKEVDGQRVYTSGYTISYDSDTPLLTGSGVAVEPETNKRIASYMFKNDIYTKYTNIEVSYMYADWELYSDTIEANKVFSIKYDDTQTPSKIKVRLYKIENGQRVYSKDTIL